MASLAEQLDASLGREPAAPAIEWRQRWCTWARLRVAVDAITGALDVAGVGDGAPVAVVARSRPGVAAAIVALLRSGRTVVPINPLLPPGALATDLDALAWSAVVVDDDDRPLLAGTTAANGPVITVVGDASEVDVSGRAEPSGAPSRPLTDRVAVLLGTSGTTGPPKRVPIRYADLEHALDDVRARYRGRTDAAARPKGVAILHTPPVNITGVWSLISELVAGRSIALLERFDVEGWVSAVVRHRPVGASIPPAALRMVLDADVPPEALASLRAIWSGSAPLAPDLAERFEARYDVAVLPIYGATEFTAGIAGWTLREWREWRSRKRGSVGRCQPGVEVRIIDETSGAELPVGAEGLVSVRSTHTVGARPDQWVTTTDLGRLDADAFLWVTGRADDVINRGGHKVAPGEVEDVLRAHPDVADAAVVGLPDPRLGQVPAAAVVPAAGRAPDVADLVAWARERLLTYKVPAHVAVVDELPRNAAFKVVRPEVVRLLIDHVEIGP